jgi:hypothetical protein
MAIAAFVQGPHPLILIARIFRAAMGRIADPYRPEKHYMRGPGPKCRAKAAAQLRG